MAQGAKNKQETGLWANSPAREIPVGSGEEFDLRTGVAQSCGFGYNSGKQSKRRSASNMFCQMSAYEDHVLNEKG